MLEHVLAAIETQYGKAHRVWVMDRGIPTQESLEAMRKTTVSYLVGTPKGRLTQLERAFLPQPWAQVRESVQVKRLEQRVSSTCSRTARVDATKSAPCGAGG